MIKKFINLIFNILALPYHIVVNIPRAVKAFARWFIEAIKETIAQTFTLLGFFIAWLTLTGLIIQMWIFTSSLIFWTSTRTQS